MSIPEMTECLGLPSGEPCATGAQHPEYTGMLRANSEAWLLPDWHPVWTTCGCGNLGYFICPECLTSWSEEELPALDFHCDCCGGERMPDP